MLNRFRSSLHDKVHDVKIGRQSKQISDTGPPDDDQCETSSASSSESDFGDLYTADACGFAVDVTVHSIVDLRAAPFYFYVCLGEIGELSSRKKRRGIQSSGVYHTRSPLLLPNKSSFMLPLTGLQQPEVSIRFSRSSIVGPDSFLGECRFPVNLKGSVDSLSECRVDRLTGGSNAMISIAWRVVPNTGDLRRSDILPRDPTMVSETDRLNALVDSVRKCILSMVEDEKDASCVEEMTFKRNWIVSLLQTVQVAELDYLLVRIGISDLLRLVPDLLVDTEKCLSGVCVLARARLVKAVQMLELGSTEALVVAMIVSCPAEDVQELKFLLNRGGDKFNLLHLVYTSIQSELLRESVLLKFQQSAVKRVHVISEIDHVIHSPFGSVKFWAEGVIPGFKALFEALSKETTFVCNKPLSFQSWSHKLVRETGMGDAPVLTGAKSDLYAIRKGLSNLNAKVACSKYSNWSMYRRLFPDTDFVWFGESVEFARTLFQDEMGTGTSQRFGVGKLKLACIMGEQCRKAPKEIEPGIYVCGNFIQASLVCLRKGYLAHDHVESRLLLEFDKMLDAMEKSLSKKGKRHRNLVRDRLSDMQRDLQLLRSAVGPQAKLAYGNDDQCKEDLVDSLVLTPIEALSPCLTNHSPSPGPSFVTESYEPDQFVLNGLSGIDR